MVLVDVAVREDNDCLLYTSSERLSWTFEEVDAKLKGIMEGIFHASYDASVAAGRCV